MAGDPDTRAVIARMIEEARAVGQALGAAFEIDIGTRIGWAADAGAHKTSMLQDFDLGRPLEIDALVSVVCEKRPCWRRACRKESSSVALAYSGSDRCARSGPTRP